MCFIFLIFYVLNIITCLYDVPSYYGHFSRLFFNVDKIRSGTFRYFQYHYAVDVDSSNKTLYFANSKSHCIQMFDLTSNSKSILAGTCGVPGDRVGGKQIMLFNNPMSVVSFQYNFQAIQEQSRMKMLIVSDKNCNQSRCILSDVEAKSINLTVENLRPKEPITQFPQINPQEKRFLFISDTNNHCIKMIDLDLQSSKVVAGECGESGFKDGPRGYNRLNRPTNLGITKSGTVYFYDKGNQYMRKLSVTGQVFTLLNGACKQYGKTRQVRGYSFRNILCYDNWVQLQTKAENQHIINQKEVSFCINHSSKC